MAKQDTKGNISFIYLILERLKYMHDYIRTLIYNTSVHKNIYH